MQIPVTLGQAKATTHPHCIATLLFRTPPPLYFPNNMGKESQNLFLQYYRGIRERREQASNRRERDKKRSRDSHVTRSELGRACLKGGAFRITSSRANWAEDSAFWLSGEHLARTGWKYLHCARAP